MTDIRVATAGSGNDQAVVVNYLGTEVTITKSAGADGAVVIFIDTDFEPDRGAWDGRSEGPGLRVNINDDPTFVGVPWEAKDGE
jgi:hypothetical protein